MKLLVYKHSEKKRTLMRYLLHNGLASLSIKQAEKRIEIIKK